MVMEHQKFSLRKYCKLVTPPYWTQWMHRYGKQQRRIIWMKRIPHFFSQIFLSPPMLKKWHSTFKITAWNPWNPWNRQFECVHKNSRLMVIDFNLIINTFWQRIHNYHHIKTRTIVCRLDSHNTAKQEKHQLKHQTTVTLYSPWYSPFFIVQNYYWTTERPCTVQQIDNEIYKSPFNEIFKSSLWAGITKKDHRLRKNSGRRYKKTTKIAKVPEACPSVTLTSGT